MLMHDAPVGHDHARLSHVLMATTAVGREGRHPLPMSLRGRDPVPFVDTSADPFRNKLSHFGFHVLNPERLPTERNCDVAVDELALFRNEEAHASQIRDATSGWRLDGNSACAQLTRCRTSTNINNVRSTS